MKKHLKTLLAGAAVAGSILACTAAYARFSDSVTVTNHISVGDINISLRELEKKDGREMKYQDRRIVLPGDEISKIPRITNHSEPCWVRVKISYTDDLEVWMVWMTGILQECHRDGSGRESIFIIPGSWNRETAWIFLPV